MYFFSKEVIIKLFKRSFVSKIHKRESFLYDNLINICLQNPCLSKRAHECLRRNKRDTAVDSSFWVKKVFDLEGNF
jgi:hypothetical protein